MREIALAEPADESPWLELLDAHLESGGGAGEAELGDGADGGLDDRVGGPEGGLTALGGDGVEEGGRIGVDLDSVQDLACWHGAYLSVTLITMSSIFKFFLR